MNIIYNGVDITSSVHPLASQIIDNAGGKPDSVGVMFSDTAGLWSQWKPAKNDTLQIKHKGFDTGVMFIDHIGQKAGVFELKALSIPQESKSARTQAWEKVRFMEFVAQIAARYGFKVQTYNITNHFYERVDQLDEADFSFLSYRCLLEGYVLKIHDRTIVIYDEAIEESKAIGSPSLIRKNDLIGGFEFADKSMDIYRKCVVINSSGDIYGEQIDESVHGPTLRKKLYITNKAEANRWAKGILRHFNKYRVTGTLKIDLNTGYAAGSSIHLSETGMFDGPFFIDRLIHDFINNRSVLYVRKPLEGLK